MDFKEIRTITTLWAVPQDAGARGANCRRTTEPLIPNPMPLDCVIETVEALLIRNQSEDNINNSLEQWIDTRMLELK